MRPKSPLKGAPQRPGKAGSAGLLEKSLSQLGIP